MLYYSGQDKVSPQWSLETRTALASYVAATAQVPEKDRSSSRCVASPALWKALAALCVCEQEHMEMYVYHLFF